MHRWFGSEFNNEVWDLIDDGLSAGSPDADRELALYTAYAAARHWLEAGDAPTRPARSTWSRAPRPRSASASSGCITPAAAWS